MGLQHREEIFRLRATIDPDTIGKPGSPNGRIYSLSKIAATLGVSKALIQKELGRTAADPTGDSGGSSDFVARTPSPRAADPLGDPVAQARQRYELERLAAGELDLKARRLEAERRLELLSKTPAGDNGALLLVLESLREVRRELDTLKQPAAAAAAHPAAQAPGLIDQLAQLRQGWEAVKVISTDEKPPSSEAELGIRVALDKLNMEREERQRRLDFELEERRRQMDNDRIRSEAVAEQIRQWGPVIAGGFQQWLGKQGAATFAAGGAEGAGAGVAPAAPKPPPLAILPDRPMAAEELGQVEGPCPSCGVRLRLKPSPEGERCPACQMPLAAVDGKIWPKMPSGPVPRFAG